MKRDYPIQTMEKNGKFVGLTVVSAHCCTDCVLDHMRVAARTRKEHETLARFMHADENFCSAKHDYNMALNLLRRCADTLFDGKDLSNLDTLINELDIMYYGLPDRFCLPY